MIPQTIELTIPEHYERRAIESMLEHFGLEVDAGAPSLTIVGCKGHEDFYIRCIELECEERTYVLRMRWRVEHVASPPRERPALRRLV